MIDVINKLGYYILFFNLLNSYIYFSMMFLFFNGFHFLRYSIKSGYSIKLIISIPPGHRGLEVHVIHLNLLLFLMFHQAM